MPLDRLKDRLCVVILAAGPVRSAYFDSADIWPVPADQLPRWGVGETSSPVDSLICRGFKVPAAGSRSPGSVVLVSQSYCSPAWIHPGNWALPAATIPRPQE